MDAFAETGATSVRGETHQPGGGGGEGVAEEQEPPSGAEANS